MGFSFNIYLKVRSLMAVKCVSSCIGTLPTKYVSFRVLP